MTFLAWPEITQFNNIRKYTKSYPEILNGNSIVKYRAKIKLHGTNSAIRIYQDGRVIAQSRTMDLVEGADNCGFAKWVEANKKLWLQIADDSDEDVIIYGEFAGKGVQSGVAIGQIDKKIFAVFAARLLNHEDSLIVEPWLLTKLVEAIPDTYVLPWCDAEYEVNWAESAESLAPVVERINQHVFAVEQNDPWVENTFGIKGIGEGLVLYPVSTEHTGYINYKNLTFKAKGDKHKNIKTSQPAQVDASTADSINQFVEMVLTEARLDQGVHAVDQSSTEPPELSMKYIGKFIAWVVNDVQKETKDELAASNLEWKQVSKAVGDKARAWYIEQVNKVE